MITRFKIFENLELDERLIDTVEFDDRIDKIDKLIKKGANVNCKSTDGYTPLIYSIFQNRIRIADYLLKNGADINLKDNDGLTPLMWAAECNSFSFIQLLIDAGADWNLKDNDDKDFIDYLTEEIEEMINTELTANKYNL